MPPGCAIFQMTAAMRGLGRTYSTKLSVVGDIRDCFARLLNPLVAVSGGTKRPSSCGPGSAGRPASAGAARRVGGCAPPRRRMHRSLRRWLRPMRPYARSGRILPLSAKRWRPRNMSAFFSTVLHRSNIPFTQGRRVGMGNTHDRRRQPWKSLTGDRLYRWRETAPWRFIRLRPCGPAAHEDLPITFVIMNNREYNVLKEFHAQSHGLRFHPHQPVHRHGYRPADDRFSRPWHAPWVLRHAPDREKASDIAPAIEAGIASSKPNLLEIAIST